MVVLVGLEHYHAYGDIVTPRRRADILEILPRETQVQMEYAAEALSVFNAIDNNGDGVGLYHYRYTTAAVTPVMRCCIKSGLGQLGALQSSQRLWYGRGALTPALCMWDIQVSVLCDRIRFLKSAS